MLRVQRTWWFAGLSARVDWEHLQGADHDLAPVREGAKAVIAWVLLRSGFDAATRSVDWTNVRGADTKPRIPHGPAPSDWIGGQLWYFAKNAEKREKDVGLVDAASWSLFITSAALGAVLWLWLVAPTVRMFFEDVVSFVGSYSVSKLGFDVQSVAWILLACGAIAFRMLNRDIRKGWFAAVLTGGLACVAAFAIALTLVRAQSLIVALTGPDSPQHAVPHAVMVTLVALSAVAGALRYLVERLNIEAEALGYRDAGERFERAERILAEGAEAGTGRPADEATARRLVYQLGCLALAENEAWLKSRRERPLTPVVG
jgi:hypothetical protein